MWEGWLRKTANGVPNSELPDSGRKENKRSGHRAEAQLRLNVHHRKKDLSQPINDVQDALPTIYDPTAEKQLKKLKNTNP